MRANRQIIEAVMEWAESRLAEELNVTSMARRAGYSEAHFSRLFSSVVGEGPGGWLVGRRVARAAECLRSGNAHVLDVALTCGFSDVTTFARAFRRRTGLSPSAYRRATGADRAGMASEVREIGRVSSPPFRLCGLVADVAADPAAPAALWHTLRRWLADHGDPGEPRGLLQVAFWRGDPQALYTCAVGFVCDEADGLPLPFATLGVPGALCRRFVVDGPVTHLAAAYEAIYGDLLPAAGDRLAANFVIERARPDGGEGVEIWVPIAGTVDGPGR